MVSTLRTRGISMQYIRRALDALEQEMTLEYALASRRLYHDGVKVFFDYAEQVHEPKFSELAEVLRHQLVLDKVIEKDLELITFASDGWAGRLILPFAKREIIEVDPHRGFGRPLFIRGGAPMPSVLSRIRAGDDPEAVADDFGVPKEHVLDILRGFVPEAS